MSPRQVVVAGYGMAGARLAEEVRRREPDPGQLALTVLGAESEPAYNRVLLSGVLAGRLPGVGVHLQEPDWAQRSGVDLRLGVAATGLDRARREVTLADGSAVRYDALVLATGARPWLPPTPGLCGPDGAPAPGVRCFRTVEDCAQIVEAARPGAPVAVLGGGLLGLEAARGLAGRGSLVTVVHPVAHLMERQLDPVAGAILAGVLAELGIEFRLGVTATAYRPGDGLSLSDGRHVPADLVVVAAGALPDTALAEAAGLACDRGVLVDDALRTDDPRVHAIGDCARHPGTLGGFVQPAWEQAAVLADLLTGANPAARYRGTPAVTRLKVREVDLAALGEAHLERDDPGVEVLRLEDSARGRYCKLVLRGDRVAGAILLGTPDAAARITQLYDRGDPVPTDRLALLLGRALPEDAPAAAHSADLPPTAVVCRCNTVTKQTLVRAWQDGARDVPALAGATRATTGCGGCTEQVRDLAARLAEAAEAAAQDPHAVAAQRL
ncbi:assimilatory nitrate reductase electron transfer subunit [Crossiella equi]|uniref:Assimilatory nitrate reductase electron transfer subunit n=1 Tax=Crossiella equi TaxID=130796 RepID=A0ABS5ALR4_9PSEU|nr:FAD-dependent oxidoreductase [Crossiella equi]MBP2477227.1 assimilatory nitrate reductase electron transfer subunit [Crossiella equi]